MSKVWVLHPVDRDISMASDYGTVQYIAERGVNIFNVEQFTDGLVGILGGGFKKDDMFLMVGNLVGNALTLHVLLQLFGNVNVLIFHARSQKYVKMVIEGKKMP